MELTNKNQTKKCYNSASCILSVVIIVFVLGAIVWDITISKPQIRKNINEIKMEIQEINEKVEMQSALTLTAETFKDSIK